MNGDDALEAIRQALAEACGKRIGEAGSKP
jgi:hypothetical protein